MRAKLVMSRRVGRDIRVHGPAKMRGLGSELLFLPGCPHNTWYSVWQSPHPGFWLGTGLLRLLSTRADPSILRSISLSPDGVNGTNQILNPYIYTSTRSDRRIPTNELHRGLRVVFACLD